MITLLNSGPSLEFRPADGGSLDVFLSDIRKAGIKRNVTQVRCKASFVWGFQL